MIHVPPHITNTKLHDDIRTRRGNSVIILRKEKRSFLEKQFPFLFSKAFFTSVLVICLIFYTSHVSFLKADTAVFYPTACLGGYDSPKLAEGKPETAIDANPDYFTVENSAYLPEDRVADLFCGNFDGKVEEHTVPKTVNLTIHLALKNKQSSVSPVENGHSSTLLDVLDATGTPILSESAVEKVIASSTLKTEIETVSTPAEKIKESIRVVVPVEAPVTKPEEHALLKHIFSQLSYIFSPVYAENTSQGNVSIYTASSSAEVPLTTAPNTVSRDEGKPADSAITAPVTKISKESATSSNITVIGTTTILANEKSSSTNVALIEKKSEEPSLISKIADNLSPFSKTVALVATSTSNPEYEILYSKGDDKWESVALIGKENAKIITFVLPYTPATWGEISSLQIQIKALQTFEQRDGLYIDGMKLSISYDTELKTDDAREYVLSKNESIRGDLTVSFEGQMGVRKMLNMKAEKENGLAIYNLDTEALLFTTQLTSATTTFDPNGTLPDFGTFVAVLTNDAGWCGQKAFFECLSATTTVDASFFSLYSKEDSKESKAVLTKKERIRELLVRTPKVNKEKEIYHAQIASSTIGGTASEIIKKEEKKKVTKEKLRQHIDQSATSSNTLTSDIAVPEV